MDFLSQLANYNTNHQDNNDNPNWIASSMPANPINSFSMPSSVHKLPGSTSHLDTTTYQDQVPFDNTAVSSTTDTTTTQSTTTTTTTTLRTDKPKTSRSAKDKNRPKRKQVKNACVNCQKACKKCDEGRPCQRCIKLGLTATCVDSPRKERKKGIKRGPYRKRQQQQDAIGSEQHFAFGYNNHFNASINNGIFASPSGAQQFVQQQRAGFTAAGSSTVFANMMQQKQQEQACWPNYAHSNLCHLQPNQFYQTSPQQQQQQRTSIDLDPYSFLMQNDPVVLFPSQQASSVSAQPASNLYPNSPSDSLAQSSPTSSTLTGSSPEPPTTPPLMSSQTSSAVFVPPYVPSHVAYQSMQAGPSYYGAAPLAKQYPDMTQQFPIFHLNDHATGKVYF